MMSGYNWSKGKSNNAVRAEEEGLLKLSDLKGIEKAVVKAGLVRYAEKHHASKRFNWVYYYSWEAIKAAIEKLDEEEKINLLKKPKKEVELKKAKITFFEWEKSGSRYYRGEDRILEGVVKGNWFHLVKPDGSLGVFKKSINGNTVLNVEYV